MPGGGMTVVRTMSSCSARFSMRETVACDMCMMLGDLGLPLAFDVIHLRDPGDQS